VIYALIIWFL